MARQGDTFEQPQPPLDRHAPRVLIVASSAERRKTLSRALSEGAVRCALAQNERDALEMIRPRRGVSERFELVLVDLPRCSGEALTFVRELEGRQVPAVIVCPHVSFDEAVEAMRAGAADIVSASLKPRELARRVRSAVAQQRAGRPRPSDEPAPSELGAVTPEVAARNAKRLAAGKVRAGAEQVGNPDFEPGPGLPIDEFARRIRAELDVETLLRQVLEFVLAQIGPTNATIFLPGSTGDYSLGAYVNYSCPKDTAEVLLDHLANVAAPRLERLTGIKLYTDSAALEATIGDGAEWLGEHTVLAMPCRSEKECLAVFMLFRDRATPFLGSDTELLASIGEVFAAQLARVIKVHHRHLPRDQWGALGEGFDTPGDDSGGLAA